MIRKRLLAVLLSGLMTISSIGSIPSFAAVGDTDEASFDNSFDISFDNSYDNEVPNDEFDGDITYENSDSSDEASFEGSNIDSITDEIAEPLKDGNSCGPNATYTFDSGTGTLTISGTGEVNNNPWYKTDRLNVKSVVINEGITQIAYNVFGYLTNLTSVSLPESLITIGSCAFQSTGLTEIVIPQYVTTVSCGAFKDCTNLKTVDIRSCLITSREESIFENASISTVIFNQDMTNIPAYFFSWAGFDDAEITIPDNVKEIKDSAFNSAKGIKEVKYGADSKLTTIGGSAFKYVKTEKINLPNSLKTIGGEAFMENTLVKEVVIPEKLTTIGKEAFYNCNISEINIPSSVTSIGTAAFNCSELEKVYFAAVNMTSPGSNDWLFRYAPLSEITFADNIETIPDYLFYGAGFDDCHLVIPKNVKKIGQRAFFAVDSGITGITEVTFEDGSKLQEIGDSAFEYANIKEINLPDSLVKIGNYAFEHSALESVVLPSKISEIGNSTFAETKLQEIVIPDGVKKVDRNAFYISTLKKATIPASVKEFGEYAFYAYGNPLKVYVTKGSAAYEWATVYKDIYNLVIAVSLDIKYELNGGINNPSNISAFETGDIVELYDPTRVGYKFEGWFTDKSFKNSAAVTIDTKDVTADLTFYAKWSAREYTVTYDANGDEQYPATVTAPDFTLSYDNVYPVTVGNVKPSREEFYFLGWYTEKDGGEKIVPGVTKLSLDSEPEGKVVLYAHWKGASACEDPEVTVAPGTVNSGTIVGLYTQTLGALIYYTIDGSQPSVGIDGKPQGTTSVYSEEFTITGPVTINALTYLEGYKKSPVVTFVYSVSDDDWGDVDKISPKFFSMVKAWKGDKSYNLPSEVWFAFGNEEDGYGAYLATDTINISKDYTGEKITFNEEVYVFYNDTRLIENRDYTVSYANNVNAYIAGSAKKPTVTIKGKGAFNKQIQFHFNINQRSLDDEQMGAYLTSESNISYVSGKTKLSAVKPNVEFNGKKLSLNKDYEIIAHRDSASGEIVNTKDVVLNDPSKVYVLEIAAKANGNFADKLKENITVKTVAPASNIVQVSKLKVTLRNGKAVTEQYTGYAVDVKEKFNNGEWVVKAGKTELRYEEDYTVLPTDTENDDQKSAGKHSFTIIGVDKGDDAAVRYLGSKIFTYNITGFAINKAKIYGLLTTVEYTGEKITIDDLYNAKTGQGYGKVTLYNTATKTPLTEDVDYKLTKSNTGVVGKFDLIFTGINGNTGTVKKTVTVKAKNVSSGVNVTLNENSLPFVKTGSRPSVTVSYKGKELKEGIDYQLIYKNNTKILSANAKGAPTVAIKGLGNYTGTSKAQSFTITKAGTGLINLVCTDVTAGSKNVCAAPKFYEDGKALSVGKNKDLEIISKTYTNHLTGETIGAKDKISAGTVIDVTVTAKCGEKSPYTEGTFEFTGSYRVIDKNKDISKYSISIKSTSKDKLVFKKGEPVVLTKSDFEFKSGGKVVAMDYSNFTIESITNNSGIGTATVVIKGTGSFGGSKTVKFKITSKEL